MRKSGCPASPLLVFGGQLENLARGDAVHSEQCRLGERQHFWQQAIMLPQCSVPMFIAFSIQINSLFLFSQIHAFSLFLLIELKLLIWVR